MLNIILSDQLVSSSMKKGPDWMLLGLFQNSWSCSFYKTDRLFCIKLSNISQSSLWRSRKRRPEVKNGGTGKNGDHPVPSSFDQHCLLVCTCYGSGAAWEAADTRAYIVTWESRKVNIITRAKGKEKIFLIALACIYFCGIPVYTWGYASVAYAFTSCYGLIRPNSLLLSFIRKLDLVRMIEDNCKNCLLCSS